MSDLVEESNSLKKAEKDVDMLGLPRPEKPVEKYSVKWPKNISDLSQEELAQHLTWWSGWSSYARYHLGRAETNLDNANQTYSLEMDRSMYRSRDDFKTVKEATASITQRPDMIRQKKKIQEAKALVTSLKSLLKGYEEKYATISREISRRGMDIKESFASEGNSRWSV